MKFDFYDDMSMYNNFMPYEVEELNNMPTNFKTSTNKMTQNMDNFNMNNFNMNNQNNSLNLFSPYEGYIRGNGFRDQYVPYKNYQPAKLNFASERDEMMANIGQYSFMAHEMNLWLDTHPEDREALRKFHEFRDKANELIKDYERKYGPLSVSGDVSEQTPFNWVTTKWPWVK